MTKQQYKVTKAMSDLRFSNPDVLTLVLKNSIKIVRLEKNLREDLSVVVGLK